MIKPDRTSNDELLNILLEAFITENRAVRTVSIPTNTDEKWYLLRTLMIVRPPLSVQPVILEIQDQILSALREAKGITLVDTLPQSANNFRILGFLSRISWSFGKAISRPWQQMRLSMQPTRSCWAASSRTIVVSITPSIRRLGSNCAWNATRSCGGRAMMSRPDRQSLPAGITCQRVMCCTRLARYP